MTKYKIANIHVIKLDEMKVTDPSRHPGQSSATLSPLTYPV